MKNLCLIPARSGSKRIPHKNIKRFAGKCILEYSLETAKQAALFDRIVVSSDSDKIGMVAAGKGATYLKRSPETSKDESTLYPAVMEVLKHYATDDFDNVCILYACAPFVTQDELTKGYSALILNGWADTVFPVTNAGYFERLMSMDEEGKIDIIFSDFTEINSQTLRPIYQHVGAWFWCRVSSLLFNGTILPADKCSGVYVSPWQGNEIDTELDWAVAERIYEATH